jgi:hypothetical protein
MKKLISVLVVSGFVLFAASGAFATPVQSFNAFWATDDASSTGNPDSFTTAQTPYLFVQFYAALKAGEESSNRFSLTWQDKGITKYYSYPADTTTWLAGNSFHWLLPLSDFGSDPKVGTWIVATDDANQGSAVHYSSTTGLRTVFFKGSDTFKINAVPEPFSCALFAIGGGVLAISRRKKRLN